MELKLGNNTYGWSSDHTTIFLNGEWCLTVTRNNGGYLFAQGYPQESVFTDEFAFLTAVAVRMETIIEEAFRNATKNSAGNWENTRQAATVTEFLRNAK